MEKPAETQFELHPLLSQRYSPRAFDQRPVPAAALGSLFEAARWAPSCFNEQPWTFLVAARETDPEGFAKLSDCLMPANRVWAEVAPVLALSVAKRTFTQNGKPNRHAAHDVGLATAHLVIQAEALGLSSHQMGGFDGAKAVADLGVPEDFEPMAMLAIGYRGEVSQLSDDLAAREVAPRVRRSLDTTVYGAVWGQPSGLLPG